jgi:hypothetical protein
LHVGGLGRTFAGWFDGEHLRDMARCALAITRRAAGVYFIPNPVASAIAGKRMNDIKNVPHGFALTHDADILERRFLIVDVDPRRTDESNDQDRPTTARELVFARRIARDYVQPYLARRGYTAPVVMCSGNGIHLVYRYSSPLPVAGWGRASDPIAAALADLAARFTCFGAAIDTNTFNPSRMLKVPGTFVRKGEATRTRPHRLAKLLTVPDEWRKPDAPTGATKPTGQREPDREVGTKATGKHTSDQPALFDRGEPQRTPVH